MEKRTYPEIKTKLITCRSYDFNNEEDSIDNDAKSIQCRILQIQTHLQHNGRMNLKYTNCKNMNRMWGVVWGELI